MQGSEQPLLPNQFTSPIHGAYGPSGMLVHGISDSNGGKVLSAPLGGLPAMATQLAEAEDEKQSRR